MSNKIIDEIIEEFGEQEIDAADIAHHTEYNGCVPFKKAKEFLSIALQKAIRSERERCIGCVPEVSSDGDTDWGNGYDKCRQEVLNAINKEE